MPVRLVLLSSLMLTAPALLKVSEPKFIRSPAVVPSVIALLAPAAPVLVMLALLVTVTLAVPVLLIASVEASTRLLAVLVPVRLVLLFSLMLTAPRLLKVNEPALKVSVAVVPSVMLPSAPTPVLVKLALLVTLTLAVAVLVIVPVEVSSSLSASDELPVKTIEVSALITASPLVVLLTVRLFPLISMPAPVADEPMPVAAVSTIRSPVIFAVSAAVLSVMAPMLLLNPPPTPA